MPPRLCGYATGNHAASNPFVQTDVPSAFTENLKSPPGGLRACPFQGLPVSNGSKPRGCPRLAAKPRRHSVSCLLTPVSCGL